MTTVFDLDLAPGARNAIRVCLNVQPHERVTVVADRDCEEIAASLVHEIEEVGAPYKAFILEEVAPRPLGDLPAVIAEDMERSQVSILAVHCQRNELRSRMQLTDIVNRRKMRHGHMVNINHQMMLEGMRADFHKVDRLSTKVIDIVRNAKQVRATTRGGSDFKAELNPNYRWVKTSGLISPDKWGNLPGGEVFTSPGNVDGTLVDRRRGRRLPLREVRQPGRDAAHAARQGQPPGRSLQREQGARRRFLEVHAHRRELRPRRRVRDRHQHRARVMSSATSCRTRSFRASTSRSATPTACTPAPTGSRRRTSTWSRPGSTSGLTIARSWKTESS